MVTVGAGMDQEEGEDEAEAEEPHDDARLELLDHDDQREEV